MQLRMGCYLGCSFIESFDKVRNRCIMIKPNSLPHRLKIPVFIDVYSPIGVSHSGHCTAFRMCGLLAGCKGICQTVPFVLVTTHEEANSAFCARLLFVFVGSWVSLFTVITFIINICLTKATGNYFTSYFECSVDLQRCCCIRVTPFFFVKNLQQRSVAGSPWYIVEVLINHPRHDFIAKSSFKLSDASTAFVGNNIGSMNYCCISSGCNRHFPFLSHSVLHWVQLVSVIHYWIFDIMSYNPRILQANAV